MARLSQLGTKHWLLLLLGFAFFYFYSGGGPNQGSRFNLDRAILEEGRLTIDSYHKNTEDKARHAGHYYSDKAPGTSFFALPALVVSRVGLHYANVDTDRTVGAAIQIRVATWSAATIPALMLCFLVYRWTIQRGYSRVAAVYSAIALGLASPFWAYSSLFWGNSLAACCLVYTTFRITKLSMKPVYDTKWGPAFWVGIVAGWTVMTEFPTAPMVLVLTLVLLANLTPWTRYFGRLVALAFGALLVASLLGTYNYFAFGSPFHLGYASVQGFEGMKQGFFGITWPRAEAFEGVIWGPRGLFVTAPVLIFGFAGHVVSIVRRKQRLVASLCLGFSVYPVLLNLSYAYWDGGWTYGPRHSSMALPFMALGLAPLYDALHQYLRSVAVVTLLTGAFSTLMAVSVHGMPGYDVDRLFPDLYWPAFWSGRFAKHDIWDWTGGPATNFGLALGLKTQYSLIPFFMGMAVLVVGLLYSLRRTTVV
jgi:hypothetical protein